MKQWNLILGPMAVVAGLGLLQPTVGLAQDSAQIIEVAAPAPKASPAQALPPLFIWDAQTTGGAQVKAWGNGAVQSTPGRNGTTLQATTRNFEEGIRFDLKKPVDIAPYRRNGFWRLRVQLGGAQSGRGRGRNQTPGTTLATGQAAPLTQLRLQLVLDNGVIAGLIPVAQPAGSRNRRGGNWQNLLLPVRNMASTRGASGLVRRIILTGDSVASFGIEQVALVAETNRISATVRRSIDPVGTDLKATTLKPGRSATLMADVNGGTSELNVQWNFNADNNPAFPLPATGRGAAQGARMGTPGAMGRRIDAVGVSARPNWPNEENDYRVEVTITDRAGKKPAVKKSFVVKIRA